MDTLREYVWKTDENELQRLIDMGYDILYQDVNLHVIYDEIAQCIEYKEVDMLINYHFGYYGLCKLLYVNGIYHWMMQV